VLSSFSSIFMIFSYNWFLLFILIFARENFLWGLQLIASLSNGSVSSPCRTGKRR
jgi:hypothetical protein